MVAHLERGCVSLGVGGGTPLDLSQSCMYFIGHARGFSTGHAQLLHWHSELPDGVCTLSKWLEKAACGRTPDVRRGTVQVWSRLLPRCPCRPPCSPGPRSGTVTACLLGRGSSEPQCPPLSFPVVRLPPGHSHQHPSQPLLLTRELLGQRCQPWIGLTEGSGWGQRSWGSTREAGFSSEKG